MPLTTPATGDVVLDAALASIYGELAGQESADHGPVHGRGADLLGCLVPELFDLGQVVWDDDAVDRLPPAEQAKLKRDADLQYRLSVARRRWHATLLRELGAAPEGRAQVRRLLPALAASSRGPVLAMLLSGGSPDDLRAIASVVSEDADLSEGVYGAIARLTLDPAWADRFFQADHGASPTSVASALIAVERLTPKGELPDPRWLPVALSVLHDPGYAQFGRAVACRFPADDALLDALLRDPPTVRDHVMLLARHDDPRVLAQFVGYAPENSLGDASILAALEGSAHAEPECSRPRPRNSARVPRTPVRCVLHHACARHGNWSCRGQADSGRPRVHHRGRQHGG